MPVQNNARRTVHASLLVAALSLSACSSSTTDDPYLPYSDPVVVRPAADSPDVNALASGLNDIGYDLFQYLASQGDEDIVLSPLSIGIAFGMLDLGATGTVAQALEEMFGYPVDGEARWSAFNTLEQSIVTDPNAAPAADDGTTQAPIVRVANREFYNTDFVTVEGYDDALMKWFGAGVEPLPLGTDTEGSRKHINSWVEDKTMGLIPELLPEGFINPLTEMVLVNALYLKAPWATPFTESATEDGDFALLNGSTVSVPLMHNDGLSTVATIGDGYTAVELPYTGDLSMLVVLPDEGRYNEIESGLGGDFISEIDLTLSEVTADLYFPRFTSEATFNLRNAIETGLGIGGVFGVPDLKGIGEGIFVDGAVHAAKIVVNEEGTEAAAATAIALGRFAMEDPGSVVEIRVDRPFLYLIRDSVTGAVLFVGRVLDPGA